jgi:hypothetical protein
MADYGTFTNGGISFPLTAATTNTLLKDADPAIYYGISYLAGVLDLHIGARLTSQAALEGYTITTAAREQLTVEPSPHLLADQLLFPILALYRLEETHDEHTAAWEKTTGIWELAWILPPLTPRQQDKLTPILHAAARVLSRAVSQGWDPAYSNGLKVWQTAGIQSARMTSVKYGAYERIDGIPQWYRTLVARIEVVERTSYVSADFGAYTGENLNLDIESGDETVVADVAQWKTAAAPTVTSLSPSTGTKAGGTAVTITGTGFAVGNTPSVSFGNIAATSVVVVSATSITCVTPAHDAYTSFTASVVVENPDGQQGTLSDSFTFTTP